MKPKNLLVTDIYLGHELLVELGLGTQFLLKLHDVLVVCLASFISFSYLVCPLVLVCEHVFLHLLSRKGGWSACSGCSFLKKVGHVHGLFMALEEIVSVMLVELTKALDNLVLAWSVDLLKSLLHLCLKSGALHVCLLDPWIFGVNQETKVLAFFLKKSESIAPFDVTAVPLFLDLDDF
jgi:hypothetical protein